MSNRTPTDWRAWLDAVADRVEDALDRLVSATDRALASSARAGAVVQRWIGEATRGVRAAAGEAVVVGMAAGRDMAAAAAQDARYLARWSARKLAAFGRMARRGYRAGADWSRPRFAAARDRLRSAGIPTPRLRVRPVHVAAVAGAGLVAASALYANCGMTGCPDVTTLAAFQPGGASMLLDRNGAHFADLAPFERAVVPLDSLPGHVPAAFLAVEDHRFYRHRGLDLIRVIGAARENIRSRGVREGSSTIPMQLARNVFPDRLPGTDRTFKRKLQEIRVAQLLERQYTKDEILELYLNHIYFGGGAYGVEAAARLFFDKSASDLTMPEAATLAALPKAPTHYDPRRNPDRATERRDLVLSLMARHGLATPDEAAEAREAPLAARVDGRDRSGIPLGAYFVDVARDQLEAQFGESLYRQRLVVHTTLDTLAQAASERELAAQLGVLDGRVRGGEGELQGAVVILEAHTGDVLALVGGRDPATSRYNRATKGRRQVGSAFKPFVFAAAIARGIPTSQLLLDTPLRMQLSRNDVWQPSNYDGRFEGEIALRQALVRSRNVPTVRLAASVGIGDVATTARNAGITDPMDETPALALGTVATSPLRMAVAYTAFATLGNAAEPRYILRVEDEEGRLLWEPPYTPPRPALDPALAYVVTDILRDAVDYGTGTAVRHVGFRGDVAGKTGTTNGATDVWFVGYTPDVVGAVWIGYDRPTSLGPGATGGGFAAPIWGRVMREVYSAGGRPATNGWSVPPGVQWRRVDLATGHAVQEGCFARGGERSEVFTSYNLPHTVCPRRDLWQDFLDELRRQRGGGRAESRAPAQGPRGRPLPGRGRPW
jgi:1A family penicillin-binding protein